MSVIDNTTLAADVAPAVSLDYVSRIRGNIDQLREMLGISEMEPMAVGNTINMYSLTRYNTPNQADEGDVIPLTEIKRTVAKTITMPLLKYRKLTTAEAIQKSGREIAINKTDGKLVNSAQKDIKGAFFTNVKTGTGTSTAGANLKKQLANNMAKLAAAFEDEDCSPIHFVHPDTVYGYLGDQTITTQSAFGMKYVEDFLGYGTLVMTKNVTAGDVWSTAKENLCGFYAPMDGDLANEFGLAYDETGIVGMRHNINTERAGIETLVLAAVAFCPEVLDLVFKGTIADPQ